VNARDAAITLSLALQHGGHCSIHVRTDGAPALFGCLAPTFFGAPKLEDVALKKFPALCTQVMQEQGRQLT
jgi:hypothetical protein